MSSWLGGNAQYLDRLERPRDHFVYRLYNAAAECIYVGCTRHLDARWLQHRQERHAMVAETDRCVIAGPYDYVTARRVEREQQYDLRPKYVSTIPMTRSRDDAPWAKYAPPTYVGGDL
jgi:hypothetical protein